MLACSTWLVLSSANCRNAATLFAATHAAIRLSLAAVTCGLELSHYAA